MSINNNFIILIEWQKMYFYTMPHMLIINK